MSSSRSPRDFFALSTVGYVVAGLALALTAAQVQPENWRPFIACGLLVIAGFLWPMADSALGRLKWLVGVTCGLLALAGLLVALVPSSSDTDDDTARDEPSASPDPSTPSASASTTPSEEGSPTDESTPAGEPKTRQVTLTYGKAETLFNGDLRLSTSGIRDSYVFVNLYTQALSCENKAVDVGEKVVVADSDAGLTFEVTLLELVPDQSADFAVLRRPHEETDYPACPSF